MGSTPKTTPQNHIPKTADPEAKNVPIFSVCQTVEPSVIKTADVLPKKVHLIPSFRILMLLLACGYTTINSSTFSSIHFAWVCMVNDTAAGANSTWDDDQCYGGTLPWDKSVQNIVFSAYHFGGMIAFAAPGWLIDRFGSRFVCAAAICCSAICTILIPFVAEYSYLLVVTLRVIIGVGNAIAWPTVYGVVSRWAIKSEIGFSLVICATGFGLGQFLNFMLSGIECATVGWETIFYMIGSAGLLYALLWLTVYRDELDECPWVSDNERDYIMLNRGRPREKQKQKAIPWKALFTSMPVWAALLSSLAYSNAVLIVTTFSPSFMKEVIKVHVQGNGFMTSLPLLCFTVGRFTTGLLSDIKIAKSPTVSIKIFNTVGLVGPAICLFGMSFVTENSNTVVPVALMCGLMVLSSLLTGGYMKTGLFIAPQFAGIIGSMTSVMTYVGGITQPFIITTITANGTAAEWHIVFYIGIVLTVLAALFFLVFGDGEPQPWAVSGEGTQQASTISLISYARAEQNA